MPEKQENIEDFVRKVVDQSEAQIPFNESHWLQMESMLDAQLPVVTPPGNGYYYFSNVVSILVGLVFIWSWFIGFDTTAIPASVQIVGEEVQPVNDGLLVTEDLKSDEQIELVSATEEQLESRDVEPSRSVPQKPSASAASVIATSTNEADGQVEVISERQAQTKPDDLQNNSVLPTATKTIPTSVVPLQNEGRASTSLSNTQQASEDQEETVVIFNDKQTASTTEEPTKNIVSATKSGVILLESDEKEEVNNKYDLLSSIGIDLSGSLPDLPDQFELVVIGAADGGSNESSDSPIVRRGIRSSYSRLSIAVSLAPDLSSNEIFRYNRLGRDLGLVVDYWVAPRLAISVGAFNTSKRYLVGGEEYSPPAGFWGNVTNGERPAKIDADCQVLDIPINLKYQLVNRPKLNIYASAGVSSYIMLQEDYQYELESGWKSEWGISNANQHFFGVGNLQVHFERRFGNHLAVEVAPFFKVPLTSYGHGNIRFHSMGSFFTIRKYLLNR